MSEELHPPAETAPAREPLVSLPFTYERTYDQSQAAFEKWRVNPVRLMKGPQNNPHTDEEILESIRGDRENQDWFTSEYWREKGMPAEQVDFTIDGKQVTVYNWSKDKPFTDEHITRAKRVFQEFESRFPQILDQLRYILVDDHQLPSAFGDPENYPTNGLAHSNWKAFQLYPRGMELTEHRIPSAANFDGTLTHELTHLIQGDFEPEWGEKFGWEYCFDYEDDWESRPTPDGSMKRPFNKRTGEMSPQGQFPLQPDQCVTFYAKQNKGEDIAETMVAYIYDPEYLKTVSEDKYNILDGHDAKKTKTEVVSQRVATEEIRLPEVKPETIHYYIKEPAEAK